MKSTHKRIGVLGVVLLLVCHGSALAGGDKTPVKVGEWTITTGTFETYGGVVWGGTAKGPGETPVDVRISRGSDWRLSLGAAKLTESLKVPGVGDVLFGLRSLVCVSQTPCSGPHPAIRSFTHERDGVRIVLEPRPKPPTPTRLGFDWALLPGAAPVGAKDRPQPQKAPRKEGPAPLDDPALDLLRAMLGKQKVLGHCVVVTDQPELEAAIDQGPFQKLKRQGRQLDWKLPARPGQEVAFRLHVRPIAYEVTTQGIEKLPEAEANRLLEGGAFSVSGKRSKFGANGVGGVTVGRIASPKMLALSFRGWRALRREFLGRVVLRWGRPEEEWLLGCTFPLAPKPARLGPDSLVKCLLQDLASAYDPDHGAWIDERGEKARYRACWSDGAALQGLDLSAHPTLADIPSQVPVRQWLRQTFWGLPDGEQTAKELAAVAIARSSEDNRLWQPRSAFQGKPSGWHSPATAYALAVLWQQYPDLRESNPLERILDYWVQAIAAGSPLVGDYGKAATEIVREIAPKGQAVAALHLGYRLLGKEAYAKARDAVLLSMQEDEQHGRAVYLAMSGGQGWRDSPGGARDDRVRRGRGICDFVSIYGQTCAFIGNETELGKAQAWITAALSRNGKEGENAFRSYSAASFNQRTGMLAVLRGKAAYLDTPFHER